MWVSGRMRAFTRLWVMIWFGGLAAVALFWLTVLAPPGCRREPPAAAELPRLGTRADGITVSGISSGAYMAGQFQLARAREVSGAAIIAGGPWGCAESAFAGYVPESGAVRLNAQRAISGCMSDNLSVYGVPNPRDLAARARRLADQGDIGPISDVVTDRVYLFSGTRDSVVRPSIVAAAVAFYRELGVPEENLAIKDTVPAGHAFLTMDKGGDCASSDAPYVVDCDYDQAGSLLGHLLGGASRPQGSATSGTFIEFDQRPFTDQSGGAGMRASGTLYVPEACARESGCRIHIAFHGCSQNREAVGETFIRDTGYPAWADANRLVVLFPEAAAASGNPFGCWDWWGYSGRGYLTRSAPQIDAVWQMAQRLAAPR